MNITIAQIVAMSKNQCIGKSNDLPWHLPEDLQHFKRMTTHNSDGSIAGTEHSTFNGVMVMGRKTFESMRSRPLPKRVNIIITRQTDYANTMTASNPKFAQWIEEGKIVVVDSLDKAIEVGKQQVIKLTLDTLWVIGGGDIFRQALPITERIELTQVDINVDGDTFYPEICTKQFKQVSISDPQVDEKSGIQYQYINLRRLA